MSYVYSTHDVSNEEHECNASHAVRVCQVAITNHMWTINQFYHEEKHICEYIKLAHLKSISSLKIKVKGLN